MNTDALKILFVISKTRVNKKGLVPLICRITYKSKRKPFSTGYFVNPDHWYSKEQKAKPPNKDNTFTNTQLSLIKQKINQAFLYLQVNKTEFDVDDIYLQYKGKNIKRDKTILEIFTIHNDKMKKLIGKEYSESTYNKFIEAKNHTANFIKHTYQKSDFLLSALTLKFLQDFDYYLKTVKNHKQITINKSIQRVIKIVKLAIAEGYITTYPFLLYKPKRVEKKVVYITIVLYSVKAKRKVILNAQVVYQVAKALPREEQKGLFEMLQKEFDINTLQIKKMKKPVLTKEDAIQYPRQRVILTLYWLKFKSYSSY